MRSLALANFSDEQIRVRIQEKRENLEKLRKAEKYLGGLKQKQRNASTAKDARPNELRKTVIVRLSYDGTPSTEPMPRLVVEYFVPGARWTPTYVCRLNSTEFSANIAVRALICQCTGEDWSGVRLELSTAEPMAWCALPELPSLRLGRAQPVLRKSGWRRPPIGAEFLFEDFDRQKGIALAAVPKPPALHGLSSPGEPYLPRPIPNSVEREPPDEPLDPDAITLISPDMVEKVCLDDVWEQESQTVHLRRASPTARYRYRPLSAIGMLEEDSPTDFLAYSLMRMGTADDPAKRGKLSIEQQEEAYLEILKRQEVVVHFSVVSKVQKAVSNARSCLSVTLPPGGIDVRQVAGSFDYAYSADGRVDVPSDGQFHSVALTSKSTDVDLRYIVVPREDTNVFRIAQLRNPLQAPLLAGPADVYVNGEYILSTKIATVPPKGKMELGLGVEQAIKVARNTSYDEVRSGETIVAFNELRHKIKIDITNLLPRAAKIEVRERLPIPQEGAKVDIQIDRVTPVWEKYEQKEREAPIQGGYRWRVEVPAKGEKALSIDYSIKTFVDSELIGGNRREA